MQVFLHPLRASSPLLTAAAASARVARADGVWVLDARRNPVLACTDGAPGGPVAAGVILDVPDGLVPALDLAWIGPGVARVQRTVTASLRREPVWVWCLPDLRHARMHGYRIPSRST